MGPVEQQQPFVLRKGVWSCLEKWFPPDDLVDRSSTCVGWGVEYPPNVLVGRYKPCVGWEDEEPPDVLVDRSEP